MELADDDYQPPPPKRGRGGGRANDVPEGPQLFEELFEWHEDVVKWALQVWRGKFCTTTKRTVRVILTTSYSGVGFAEVAAQFLAKAFQKHTLFDVQIELRSQTEINQNCRKVLNAPHIFCDLLDRANKNQVVKVLEGMQEKARQRYQDSPEQKERISREFLNAVAKFLRSSSGSRNWCANAYCCKCDGPCDWAPSIEGRGARGEGEDQVLWVEVAGNTCTPWSARGKRMGFLEPASIPSFVWDLA